MVLENVKMWKNWIFMMCWLKCLVVWVLNGVKNKDFCFVKIIYKF